MSGVPVIGLPSSGARMWLAAATALVLATALAVAVSGAGDEARAGGPEFDTPPLGLPAHYLGVKPVRSGQEVIVGSAGDIACGPRTRDGGPSPNACREALTADLLGSVQPDAVLPLGDNQYPNGSLDQFRNGYDRTWGRFKHMTYPVPGNHEYDATDAYGYFDYFGAAAGSVTAGYYSYDLGSWHVVALNSECDRVGGCHSGSVQERWLRADLAAHPAPCTLVYWHRPRFSSGVHGSTRSMDAFWKATHSGGADLVLVSHDHDYERFAPLGPAGEVDEDRGIRQFVVGTGGHSFRSFHDVVPGSEVRIAGVAGILQLVLRPAGYDWTFLTEPGAAVGDAGSGACR